MSMGLLGRKIGMTRVFNEAGMSLPVTVIEITPNRVTQLKTVETDGYESVQLTGGSKKQSHVNKPLAGHFAKAGVEAGDHIAEFRIDVANLQQGQSLSVVDVFAQTKYVDVTANSKGKGFAGGVKRHNFRTQDATHGNSVSHRVLGSIGQNQTPGKVFKGKKMAGHLGDVQTTVQNLEVVRVDGDRNLLLVKGGIPGAPGAKVIVRPAIKNRKAGE